LTLSSGNLESKLPYFAAISARSEARFKCAPAESKFKFGLFSCEVVCEI